MVSEREGWRLDNTELTLRLADALKRVLKLEEDFGKLKKEVNRIRKNLAKIKES